MPIAEEIRAELGRFLKERDLSRYAFSKATNIPESTVKRFLENDIKNPSANLLEKIAAGMEGMIKFKKLS